MATQAPRFKGLQAALAKAAAAARASGNIEAERLRAAARGAKFDGRLGCTKGSGARTASPTASTAKVVAQEPAPARVEATAATQPPANKLGRAETVALALRTDPKLAGYQDIALHMLDDPELKSLSGDGVVRCLKGLDPAAYRASMAKERAAKADAVWARARASIDGGPQATAAVAPQAAKTKADLVWERAYAKTHRHS